MNDYDNLFAKIEEDLKQTKEDLAIIENNVMHLNNRKRSIEECDNYNLEIIQAPLYNVCCVRKTLSTYYQLKFTRSSDLPIKVIIFAHVVNSKHLNLVKNNSVIGDLTSKESIISFKDLVFKTITYNSLVTIQFSIYRIDSTYNFIHDPQLCLLAKSQEIPICIKSLDVHVRFYIQNAIWMMFSNNLMNIIHVDQIRNQLSAYIKGELGRDIDDSEFNFITSAYKDKKITFAEFCKIFVPVYEACKSLSLYPKYIEYFKMKIICFFDYKQIMNTFRDLAIYQFNTFMIIPCGFELNKSVRIGSICIIFINSDKNVNINYFSKTDIKNNPSIIIDFIKKFVY